MPAILQFGIVGGNRPPLQWPPPNREVFMSELNRRSAIGSIVKFAVFTYPLSKELFAAFPVVEAQPLVAQVRRLVEAMEYLGEPFSEAERGRLDAAATISDDPRVIEEIQRVLDPRCLLAVRINPESRV